MVNLAIVLLIIGLGLALSRLATLITDQRRGITRKPMPIYAGELAFTVAIIAGLVGGAIVVSRHTCVKIRYGGFVGRCERVNGLLD